MSARSYVVGLPVVVTVHDDGTVTYEVDRSEAGQAVREDQFGDNGEHADADADLIDADHDRHHAAQQPPLAAVLADVCPHCTHPRTDHWLLGCSVTDCVCALASTGVLRAQQDDRAQREHLARGYELMGAPRLAEKVRSRLHNDREVDDVDWEPTPPQPGDRCMIGRDEHGDADGTVEHVAPCRDGHPTGTVTDVTGRVVRRPK